MDDNGQTPASLMHAESGDADMSALEKLADEFEWQYFDIPHDQRVYHYTSPDGLLGIVKDKGVNLRFTRYDCVNDFSEGRDVVRCYDLACRELLKDGQIGVDFYNAIKDIELDVSAVMSFSIDKHLTLDDREIDIGREYVPLLCEAYICCFSRDGDSLPMWNYYSKKGVSQGYNVGFDFGLTERENVTLLNESVHMEMVSVIYDDNEKLCDIKRIIDTVYKRSASDPGYQNCQLLIKDELKKRMFRFKSQFFAHEQEIRLVLYVPVEIPEDFRETDRLRIKYTSQNGYLVPYVDLVYKKELLHRITVGPLLEKEISIRTLQTIKTNYNYNYEIVTSNVPIRF
ncbi:Protein of unknown function [Sporobacter termitidis DSM 10068]|uniref:DUF2971 domain-containing protein n=1 Tax=Sporobacter termitidis DSM 10068 TaxID=1123282 RepID=A0A1M5TN67_9FIRM|nr:DUF2971 domain-containing protein [Sporobacter termitidis]SHH52245.1 Protein of unknown function [Sporobacter termitidis DSM 10068]